MYLSLHRRQWSPLWSGVADLKCCSSGELRFLGHFSSPRRGIYEACMISHWAEYWMGSSIPVERTDQTICLRTRTVCYCNRGGWTRYSQTTPSLELLYTSLDVDNLLYNSMIYSTSTVVVSRPLPFATCVYQGLYTVPGRAKAYVEEVNGWCQRRPIHEPIHERYVYVLGTYLRSTACFSTAMHDSWI